MLTTNDAKRLARLPLFSRVEAAAFSRAARDMVRVEGERGLPVAAVSAHPESVWIVYAGLVQLDAVWPGGEQMCVDVAGPGEMFGRLDGAAYAALQAVPLADAALIRFPHPAYRRLAAESPAFARNLAQRLAEALSESQSLRALFALPARQRLLRLLLWLRGKLGPDLPLTRRALADIAAVTPETAIRALSPLEKSGVLRTRLGRVRVLDARKLARQAGIHGTAHPS